MIALVTWFKERTVSAPSALSVFGLSFMSKKLCVSSASPRLCGKDSPGLVARRWLRLQYSSQNVILLEPVALGVEVQQDAVSQHRRVEVSHVFVRDVIAALHQGSRLSR